jgi:TetR/AcrR family transcriptional repressor of nem operon
MGRTSNARQRLMDAAHELIWEYSYGAVTIEAICVRAHVKKGSFYYFFDSKSDLAAAAIGMWWDERREKVAVIFHPDVPPIERIRRYIDFVAGRQLASFHTNGQVLGCPLFTLASEICTQDDRLRSLILGILVHLSTHFEAAITDAQGAGDLTTGNVPLKARLLFSFYEGTLTRARIENNPDLLTHLVSDSLELLGARYLLAQVA